MRPLVIATRGSPLALWQARHVEDRLRHHHPGLKVELKIIRTRGDELLESPAGGPLPRGLFTSAIQESLLTGAADLAVHSLKDLPTDGPAGLILGAIPTREDAADVLVSKAGRKLHELPRDAKVLCGCPRRAAQLLHRRSDLTILPIRGNVGTRVRKLDESDADALVLALAGLRRLGMEARVTERFDPADFIPACGQGALAVEIRRDDQQTAEIVAAIDDPPSRVAVTAERAFLAALGGGCQAPAGAYCTCGTDFQAVQALAPRAQAGKPVPPEMTIVGMVSAPQGRPLLLAELKGSDAESLGRQLAEQLLAGGGEEIIRQIRSHGSAEGSA